MQDDNPLGVRRVDHPDDPDRCYGSTYNGPCPFKKIPGTNFCPLHGHARTAMLRKQAVFKYRFERAQARLDNFVHSSAIKSLREEIALLRLLIDEFLKNEDLTAVSTSITRLVRAVNVLAVTSAKTDAALAKILDNENAIEMGQAVLKAALPVTTDGQYAALLEGVTDLIDRLYAVAQGTTTTNYKNLRYRDKLQSYLTSDQITNLRAEIGVERLLVEETINNCNSPMDLTLAADTLTSHILLISELITSTNRLEASAGLLMDKEAAAAFTQELLRVITETVKDPIAISKIAETLANRRDPTYREPTDGDAEV